MVLVLVPIMTIMWLCTTGCVMLVIPKLTTLSAMVIASQVTCTDPILSQAIAKGPFADRYVPRALREIISAEAGANDGFGFPFLLLATFLIRHAPKEDLNFISSSAHLASRAEEVGRLGGGVGEAIETWVVEGWLYFILLGAVVGAVLGITSMFAVTFTLQRLVSPCLQTSRLFVHRLTLDSANGLIPSRFSFSRPHLASSYSVSPDSPVWMTCSHVSALEWL